MSGFLRLTYLSKACAPMSQSELKELLDACDANNAVLGITGVLCAGRGYFLQALEGMEDSVIEVYSRILKDARHRDCSLLDIGLIESPLFHDWKMGFVDGTQLPVNLFTDILALRSTNNRREQTKQLLQTFLNRLRGS
ncbi:MAG: BLUF domain-containing protein [Pseudazoarcus pumilus]|nr:BLUF domain-containing protein [Pseudazoarcus pumilus]